MTDIPPEDLDSILAYEAQLLFNNFKVDIIENTISNLKIHLKMTRDRNFVIRINFSNYPNEIPEIFFQDEVAEGDYPKVSNN